MARASNIKLPKNIDVTKITCGQVKKQANGSKMVWLNVREATGDEPLVFQTPEMVGPYGISVWPSDNGGPDKYSLDLSFAGLDSREAVKALYDFLETLEQRLLHDAMENSMAWFGKKYPSLDVIEALRTPIIKRGKGDYPPTFNMKLPLKDGKFQFPVFDGKRTEVDLFDVLGTSKGARYQAILQCTGVWIVGTKFGVTFKVRQLKVVRPAQLTGYAFQRTEDDEEEEEEEPAAAPAPRAARAGGGATLLESSEDEREGGPASDGL
jgi:hypothetical protein